MARFNAKESTTTQQLISTMKQMGASNLKVNKDLFTGKVEILFDRAGKRYIFTCENYKRELDNYRAAQLTISYLFRALESYGVKSSNEELFDRVFSNFFLGFEATPDDSNLLLGDGTTWQEILGVRTDATKEDIIQAYKALAKVHHPDLGGNKESFLKLRKAYEDAMQGK